MSAADHAVALTPAIEAASAAHGRGRLVNELGPEFGGYTAGAAWEDLKLAATPWERCAIVTDHALRAAGVRARGPFMPGAVRVFPVGERAQALARAAA